MSLDREISQVKFNVEFTRGELRFWEETVKAYDVAIASMPEIKTDFAKHAHDMLTYTKKSLIKALLRLELLQKMASQEVAR